MGRWSFGLFGSDDELDLIGDMAVDLDVETLYYPEEPNKVKDALDRDDKLNKKLSELWNGQGTHGYNKETSVALLVAAAISVGAKIKDEHRRRLSQGLSRSHVGLGEEGHRTLVHALDIYRDGEPLFVTGPGLLEAAQIKIQEVAAEQQQQQQQQVGTSM